MDVVFCTKLDITNVTQLNYRQKDMVNHENAIAELFLKFILYRIVIDEITNTNRENSIQIGID